MMKYLKLSLLAMILVMTGCASTAKENIPLGKAPPDTKYQIQPIVSNKAHVPEHFVKATENYVNRELKKRDLLASNQNQATRLVSIEIRKFRMRKGFNRQFFGVAAGKDGMDSIIEVRDKSGKLVGRFSVMTYNVLTIGSEDDIPRMHAQEIVRILAKK